MSTYDAPSGEFLLDDVNCSREARIIDCAHNDFGVENCAAIEGAGFRCETWGEGDIRFRNAQLPGTPVGALGTSTLRRDVGRLEVLHDGVWGSICDDGIWPVGTNTEPFINTACNQLGFTTGTGNVSNMWDGPASQPIWLDDVVCDAADATVPMCENRGWGVNN